MKPVALLLVLALAVPAMGDGGGAITNRAPVVQSLVYAGPGTYGAEATLSLAGYDANGESDIASVRLWSATGSQPDWTYTMPAGELIAAAEPGVFDPDGWRVWNAVANDGRLALRFHHPCVTVGTHDWRVEIRDEAASSVLGPLLIVGQPDGDADCVSDADDLCNGHDDREDVDLDAIPDGCDMEVNRLPTGPDISTRYRAEHAAPPAGATFNLGGTPATLIGGDFLKHAQARLKSPLAGPLTDFQLDIIAREAASFAPGGEVDALHLAGLVSGTSNTLVIDVLVSGLLNGVPLVSPGEVIESLELTFVVPASHFATYGLDRDTARFLEYRFGGFVRPVPLDPPTLEAGHAVYTVALTDFSSFVFVAEPLPASSGAGAGGAAGGAPAPPPAVPPVEAPVVAPPPELGATPDLPPVNEALAEAPNTAEDVPATGSWTGNIGPTTWWMAMGLALGVGMWIWWLVGRRRREQGVQPFEPTIVDRWRDARRRASRVWRLSITAIALRMRPSARDSAEAQVAAMRRLLHPGAPRSRRRKSSE